MNEEALKGLYVDLGFESGGISYDDFVNTMSSNEEARKSVFADSGLESEGVSYDSFSETLFGKKKDSTESVSEEASTDFMEEDLSSDTSQILNNPQNYSVQDLIAKSKELESSGITLDQVIKSREESIDNQEVSELERKVIKAKDEGKLLNVLNNIGNTAQNIGNSIAITLDRLAMYSNPVSASQQMIMDQAGLPGSKIQKRLAEYVNENNEQIEVNTIARSYDPEKSFEENIEVAHQGIVETFQKDGAVAGLGEIGIKTAESIPYLVGSITTGGVGGIGLTAGTFFATGYGNSIAEQQFRESSESTNEVEALLKGTVEGVSSVLFGGASKVGKDALKKMGIEEAKKIVGNNMIRQLRTVMWGGVKSSAGEGLEEMTQEVANYAIDSYYAGEEFNKERAFKIGMDALILGSAAGGPVGAAGSKYKLMRAKAVNDKVISSINNELENQSTKDNEVKKNLLLNKRNKLIEGIDSPENVSQEDASKLDKLYYDKQDLEKAIESTQDKDLREELVKDLDNNKKETQSIIDKYAGESDTGSGKNKEGDDMDVRTESENQGSDVEAGIESRVGEDTESTGLEEDGLQRGVATEVDGTNGEGDQGIKGAVEVDKGGTGEGKADVKKSTYEIHKEFMDKVFRPIQSPTAPDADRKIDKISQKIGKGARSIESTVAKNFITNEASKLTQPIMKILNEADKAVSKFTTKPVVEKLNKARKSISKQINEMSSGGMEKRYGANAMIRDALDALFPNVNMAESQQEARRKITAKSSAQEYMSRLFSGLKAHPAYNPDSMEKIFQSMDPEAAMNQVGPPTNLSTYESLNDTEKEMYDYLRATNDYIHEMSYAMGMIDDATYNKFKGKYVARMYEQIENDHHVDMAKKMGLDLSVYKKRQGIEEISEDLLSVRDPVYLTMKRFAQTLKNESIKEYTDAVASDKESSLTLEEYNALSGGDKSGFTKIPDEKRYGSVAGMYVKNNVASDLLNQEFLSAEFDAINRVLNMYDKSILRQMTKQGLTVFNPATRLVNITSSYIFSFAAGVDPITFSKNRVVAKEALDSFDEDVDYLYRNGLLSTSNINQELSIIKDKDLLNVIGEKKPMLHGMTDVIKMKDPVLRAARESYGKTDDVAKIATFKSLKEQGMSNEEALARTAKAMQNYASVGKGFALGAKIPIIGNTFVRFQADLARMTANAMIEKPLTAAIMYGAMMSTTRLISSIMSDESDEEEYVRNSRPFIPRTINGTSLMAKIGDKEVNLAKFLTPYYVYDLGSLDDNSWNPKLSPVTLSFKDGKLTYKSSDPALGWLMDIMVDQDFRNKSIRNPDRELLSPEEETKNVALYALRNGIGNVLPIKLLSDLYISNQTGLDYYGRSREWDEVLLSRIVRIEEFGDDEYKKAVRNYFYSKNLEIDNKKREISSNRKRMEKSVQKIMDMDIPVEEKKRKIKDKKDEYAEQYIQIRDEIGGITEEKLNFAEKIKLEDFLK